MKSTKSSLQGSLAKFEFSRRQQLLLLAGNYIPFLHLLCVAGSFFVPGLGAGWRVVMAAAVLYLLPPLLARCILLLHPLRETHIPIGSRQYFVWWYLLNLQMVFCRLSFLEELMRMIPGIYSQWLRLWGSRIGSFTYWGAGLRILDRSFLKIGNGVAFGAGVRINPHVITENKDGKLELLLAPVELGHGSLIGGYSLLTAGTRIADGENARAFLISPPFSHWKDGRRVREDQQGPSH